MPVEGERGEEDRRQKKRRKKGVRGWDGVPVTQQKVEPGEEHVHGEFPCGESSP